MSTAPAQSMPNLPLESLWPVWGVPRKERDSLEREIEALSRVTDSYSHYMEVQSLLDAVSEAQLQSIQRAVSLLELDVGRLQEKEIAVAKSWPRRRVSAQPHQKIRSLVYPAVALLSLISGLLLGMALVSFFSGDYALAFSTLGPGIAGLVGMSGLYWRERSESKTTASPGTGCSV